MEEYDENVDDGTAGDKTKPLDINSPQITQEFVAVTASSDEQGVSSEQPAKLFTADDKVKLGF